MDSLLRQYLTSLETAVTRVCQAQQDGYEVKLMAIMIAEDLATMLQLGGPIPRLQTKLDAVIGALDENCPRLQGESRE